jgi:hypothetical protein
MATPSTTQSTAQSTPHPATRPSRHVMRLCSAVAAMLLAGTAMAHKPSDAYIHLTVQAQEVTQRVDIALRDLDRDLHLDTDNDGVLTWREVRTRAPDLERLVGAALVVSADGVACSAGPPGPLQIDSHSDGRYAVLTRSLDCGAAPAALAARYTLFQDTDPTHRGIVRVQAGERIDVAVLAPGDTPVTLPGGDADTGPSSFVAFIGQGIFHILIGADHILFLLALLLPAVLVRRGPSGPSAASAAGSAAGTAASSSPLPPPQVTRPWALQFAGAGAARLAATPLAAPAAAGAGAAGPSWAGAPALGPVLLDVLRIVTAFTVAHSVTLALAVLDIVDPPSRWVESVIAASVVLVALNNVHPVMRESRWMLTLGFGLIHGFGFAGALKDLGLGEGSLAATLFGFNLGVEIGQLMIVAMFLALAWRVRHAAWYRRIFLTGGSWLMALVALLWLVERAFDLEMPLPW